MAILERAWLFMALDLNTIGDSGLKRMGGRIYEENLRKLTGERAIKAYSEMSENDAVIGAILFAIEMLCRQVEWHVEEQSDNTEDVDAAQFITECMDDMSHTWEDLTSEILTMLRYGWSYFEIIYKYRQDPLAKDPVRRSKYTDGRIGWRKIALRAQETLYEWEFDDDGGIKGMWQWSQYGKDKNKVFIPIEKALLFRTRTEKGNPEGRSVLRNAYRSWYMLKRIQEIEAIGIERDLAGLPVMEVPASMLNLNASDSEKAILEDLKAIVSEIRRDEREGVIVPSELDDEGKPTGYKLKLLSTGGQRAFDTNKIITRYEQRIAMSVLAEFIMLGLDKVGSFSLVSSKMNLFATALDAWLDSIEAVFNRFAVPRLFAVNGIKLEKLPQIKHGPVQDVSLEELGKFINDLGRAGMPLTLTPELENHLRNKANLPPVDDNVL